MYDIGMRVRIETAPTGGEVTHIKRVDIAFDLLRLPGLACWERGGSGGDLGRDDV
jgi:hypothetical protein